MTNFLEWLDKNIIKFYGTIAVFWIGGILCFFFLVQSPYIMGSVLFIGFGAAIVSTVDALYTSRKLNIK